MPSHQERVRRNYHCPECDGAGTVDDYEGTYPCSECNGSGILLTTRKPRSAGRPLMTTEWLSRDVLATMQQRLALAEYLMK